LRTGAVLMSTDNGGIEHHVFVIGITRQGFEYTFENTTLAPSPEASVRRFPIAETRRQIAPWNTRAVPVNDRLYEQAIVRRGSSDMTLSSGQKILDPFPLVIPQAVATHLSAHQIADTL
jgi:hypothetical protein